MITAIPKEEKDLEKDYKGIYKERLVAFPRSVAGAYIKDSLILDEIGQDPDHLDGVLIRRLLRLRTKI